MRFNRAVRMRIAVLIFLITLLIVHLKSIFN